MGYTELKYDINQFDVMINKINELKNDINTTGNTLISEIEELKLNKWNTPAGKAFFEKNDMQWNEQIKQYTTRLDEILSLLETAKAEYNKVSDRMISLRFENQ